MSSPTDTLLNERAKTHGDFCQHARITQNLKALMRNSPNWEKLNSAQLEALEMIQHKVGRILAGNQNHQDHWDDIAGYARLGSQRLTHEGNKEGTTKMQIRNIPIQIYWRALDLYGQQREDKIEYCRDALHSAEGRVDIKADFPGIGPFAQAIAEYMSLSGPFAEDGGEFSGINGYSVD